MKKLFAIPVLVLLILLSMTLVVSCAAPTPQPIPTPAPAPAPRPSPPPPFQRSVVPEEAYYLLGEIVEVKLSFTNVSSETIKLDRWPPEIQVKPRHQDEVVFSVAAGTQPLEIKPWTSPGTRKTLRKSRYLPAGTISPLKILISSMKLTGDLS